MPNGSLTLVDLKAAQQLIVDIGPICTKLVLPSSWKAEIARQLPELDLVRSVIPHGMFELSVEFSPYVDQPFSIYSDGSVKVGLAT